jgi:hypothetical protein
MARLNTNQLFHGSLKTYLPSATRRLLASKQLKRGAARIPIKQLEIDVTTIAALPNTTAIDPSGTFVCSKTISFTQSLKIGLDSDDSGREQRRCTRIICAPEVEENTPSCSFTRVFSHTDVT